MTPEYVMKPQLPAFPIHVRAIKIITIITMIIIIIITKIIIIIITIMMMTITRLCHVIENAL